MEFRRLNVNDYDALLELLNLTFANKYKRECDFLHAQPKMWVRDDEHMNKHFGIFEDGRLVSVTGIYPLPAKIADTDCLFCTTGNVATHPDYEGRGYFSKTFSAVMEEAEKIGADAARLGGARQRYARFGFEPCGALYKFTINSENRKKCKVDCTNFEFYELTLENTEELKYINELSEKFPMYVARSDEEGFRDVFLALSSKNASPYIIKHCGRFVGYLSAAADGVHVGASHNGRHVLEIRTESPEITCAALLAWQERVGGEVDVGLAPYMTEEIKRLIHISEYYTVASPSRFKFFRYERIADALLRVKAQYTAFPEGEAVISIKDYGELRFYNKDGVCGCERCDGASADVTVEKRDAATLIFGPAHPSVICDVPAILSAFLPLPLSWETNDYT